MKWCLLNDFDQNLPIPNNMKIDIYKSIVNSKKYISVPAGTDIRSIQFPDTFDKELVKLSPFKSEHEIFPDVPYIALDSNEVIKQIKEKGYAIHGAKIEITIQ
jgi:hypothetical protein